jgi:hypothetical protein
MIISRRTLNDFESNDSQAMSSSRFTVNKKRHKRITSIFSMFQYTFIVNVAINMYGLRDALVWKQCSENASVEYTITLPYNVI